MGPPAGKHDILAFERQWWKFAGAKEEAIKELFSMSATRYYQVLNALVDRPRRCADPMLVKRLRGCAPAAKRRGRRGARLRGDLTPCLSFRRFSGYSGLDE